MGIRKSDELGEVTNLQTGENSITEARILYHRNSYT